MPERTGQKVLVVDDDDASAELVGVYLSPTYEVQTATNSATALLRFERFRPDLVILDLRLGAGRDGVDVFNELRRRLGKPPTMILLSGSDEAERVARTLRVPMLTKPVNRRALRNMVRRVLGDTGRPPMWFDVVGPGVIVSAVVDGVLRRGTVFEVREGLVHFRDSRGAEFIAPRDQVFVEP
jgi:DNA-binding response OmpR family regulator